MNLSFSSAYWQDTNKKNAFMHFIKEIHNIDFRAWDEAGFWDDLYKPFSFFDTNGKVVSSVCLYTMEAMINGEEINVFQISGVGTLPEYRLNGLNRELTNLALKETEDSPFVFLFSDEEAIPFYKKAGFQPIEEYIEWMKAPHVKKRPGVNQLNINTDLELIKNYIKQRTFVSNKFGVKNKNLLGFHLIYTMKNYIYEIAQLDCLVLAKYSDNTLKIFDIVAPAIPKFEDFFPFLFNPEIENIEFYFFTDKINPGKTKFKLFTGNEPMFMRNNPFEKIVFPYTCRA